MPRIENISVWGLEDSIRAAKYAKATDLSKVNDELSNGIHACFSCQTGQGHDSALKGIVVQFDLTLSQNAWQQFERYHFADIVTSQSKMHKITKFDIKTQCNKYVDRRIIDIVQNKVNEYNRLSTLPATDNQETAKARKEKMNELYLEILYNIPCGFELTARITTNYLQLKTMLQQRRNHRLPDWKCICDFIESLPRFKELTT